MTDQTPALLDFLNALFGADAEAIINLTVDGQPLGLSPADDIPTSKDIYISPITDKGYAFAWRELTAGYDRMQIEPTITMQKGAKVLALFALKDIMSPDDMVFALEAIGMPPENNSIPAPGNGWELKSFNPDAFTTPEAIVDSFYGHANVLSPIDWDALRTNTIVMIGAGAESKNWRAREMQVGNLISLFAKHLVGPKDGRSVVLADMVEGERRKNSVKVLTGIGIDIDTGMPIEKIDAALATFGHMAIRSTTHSHGKTRTEIKKDTLQQFIVKHGAGRDPETTETLRWYLAEKDAWHPDLIETVEYSETEHTKKGIVVVATHAPISKNRIIVPLLNFYEIAKEGATQKEAMDKWAKVIEKFAAHLGVPFDRSCTDPCRLFYFPRHNEGNPFSISLHGGPLFDYKTLPLTSDFEKIADAVDNGGKSKSVTQEGKDLARWVLKRGHGFQIADLIQDHCPDRIRSTASTGFNIECPFDDQHSNAGDTDDQACFAVNGGDGGTHGFVVKCQHEGCKPFTGTDMVGKMVKDGWFDKELLESPNYNEIMDEETAEKNPVAAKIEKEDTARLGLEDMIEALTKDSNDGEMNAVLEAFVDANPGPMVTTRFENLICSKTGMQRTAWRKLVLQVKARLTREQAKKLKAERNKSDKDKHIFVTEGGNYALEDALRECVKAMKAANERDCLPTFCCIGRNIARLRVFTDIEGYTKVEVEEYEKENRFWSDLCSVIAFQAANAENVGKEEKVPEDVARHVMSQAYNWLPSAPEVLYTPVFLADGDRMEKHGYHYDLEKGINILMICNDLNVGVVNEVPERAEVDEAVAWLKQELLSDFPFMDADTKGELCREISEWNAFAMLLTPFIRRMVKGRTPVFFIEKPSPGTGGTLLGQMPMWLFDGKAGDVTTYSASEDEMQKTLLSAVRENRSHLFFDDVTEFNNRVLLRALTQANISGRLLGGNRNLSIPNNFNWIGTGNNTIINPEMRRRCCYIRLNAMVAAGFKRKFRHPALSGLDFNEFVLQNRALIIQKIMTIVQYWVSLGKPEYKGSKQLPSFEAWTRVVGGILASIGAENFFGNFDFEHEGNPEEAAISQFVAMFFKKHGADRLMQGSDLFEWAMQNGLDIITGQNEDHKRTKFIQRSLQMLKNRTFRLGDGDYTFRHTVAEDHSINYSLTRVVRSASNGN